MSDKLPKIKHNHTLTDILKASIFSLVMMAPVAAVGVTCAYVVCNKNAYQSYSGKQNTDYIEIEEYSEIQQGKEYAFNSKYGVYTNTTTQNTGQVYYSSISDIEDVDQYVVNLLLQGNNFRWYYSTSSTAIYVFLDDTQIGSRGTTNNYLTFNFVMGAFTSEVEQNYTFLRQYNYTNFNSLDNVFYYAVDTMQNNSLFSWTKNTAIYTPINAMTTGLGVETAAIAVLLTYWLLLTAMYVIIDIVIKGFTWMTHLIGER